MLLVVARAVFSQYHGNASVQGFPLNQAYSKIFCPRQRRDRHRRRTNGARGPTHKEAKATK